MQNPFRQFELSHGLLADLHLDEFPTRVSAWRGAQLALGDDGTHFGFVYEGPAEVECAAGAFALAAGMHFCLPGAGAVRGRGGLVVTRLGYRGVFSLGGPLEPWGRLRYIDGCTDSLLIPPVLCGDPCLNALYFPVRVDQTEHTHPSLRAGLVVSGAGECVTLAGTSPLRPGLAFLIDAGGLHRFRTDDESLVVVAYHPDSDFGPTHEAHPMINRTMVDGVPAARIPGIRT